MPAQAKWTVLVYMAGDNNLEGEGRGDLREMATIGSTDAVNVIVQFDTEANGTTRYLVRKGAPETVQTLPGVNCGDPKTLTDFLKWGRTNYPADRFALVVWNHGGGWESWDGIDYEANKEPAAERERSLKQLRRSVFRTTAKRVSRMSTRDRAIAMDCGSQDYLDNRELRLGVKRGLPAGGKLDLLGMDACLMSCLEVAYEMRQTARVLVASQETEPGEGWDYRTLLAELTANPDMDGATLARSVVRTYGEFYAAESGAVTQSAIDLSSMLTTRKAIDKMADALLAEFDTSVFALEHAALRAQSYQHHPQYRDLGHVCSLMLGRLPAGGAAARTTQAVLDLLPKSAVLANIAQGLDVAHSSGLSIFLPPTLMAWPKEYGDLRFAREGRWVKVLERLLE